ncbi:MAG: YHYH protein [Opitutaceae bacterium]|nr:YHYH protein [Opitutaceae bacterium]
MKISLLLRATLTFAFVFTTSLMHGQTDPHITSWVTARNYARVYETASDKTSGNAVSTWPRSGLTNGGGGQATAVYTDVQRVVYSTNYVYVYVTGLPSYTTGNWLTPNGMVYTSWPTNRGTIQKIPLNPSIPTTKQKNNGSGGLLVNGVLVWANGDAQSYNTSTGVVSMAGGQGIWNRLAGVAEAFNFDPAYGHQPNSGAYHNHINPIALRYQLGDNVTYNAATKTYAEAASITKHSPLIGWANDGLPIYGPYGYSTATDANSGIRRMTSGFVKRNSTNVTLYGTDNLAVTGRVKLPVWAASVQGKSQTLASTEYGPSTTTTYSAGGGVTSTYSIGIFAEDYEYLGDLGKTQGVDFDLNRQNVRYCVTPEYPSGTYAYFVCIDSSGASVFPDIINQEYFGTPATGPGSVTSISETVTEYKRGGQASSIDLSIAASTLGAKLTWTSVEGGTYTVATSPDGTTYTTLSASVASAGGTTTTYDTATLFPYYKVTLNAVATYDTAGNGGVSGIGNFDTAYYPAGGVAPTITTEPSGQTVTAGAKVTFTVAATGTATLTYQWFKNDEPISGATTASYVITKSVSNDAGTYSVVVTNGVGTDTSADAMLVVNEPVLAPVITTPPVAQTVTLGQPVTFTVAATSTETDSYLWRKAGVALSGKTEASYTIDSTAFADAGSYSVSITNSGGTTTSSSVSLTIAVPAPVLSFASGVPIGGAVNADLTDGGAISGITYYATGLPTGLAINKTTGQITGTVSAKAKTGTYTVTYWAQYGTLKSAVQTTQLVITTLPSGMVGSFEGLLEDGSGIPVGKVTLTVTSLGAFTGTLTTVDAKSASLKSTLVLNADYTLASKTLSVKRSGAAAYSLTVSVSSNSVLTATLAGFGTTTTGVKLNTVTGSALQGAYTLALGDPVNLGSAAAPAGDSYATATIGSTGTLVLKGKLADGTAITGSLAAGPDASYRCYLKPYKTAGGYVGGRLEPAERVDQAGRYEVSGADFYWKKPASSKDKVYPAGFGVITLSADLQKWIAPVSPVSLATQLGLDAGGGPLVLVMDGGGLSNDAPNTYTLPTTLNLSAGGLLSVTDATNPTAWTLLVNTADGSFTGSFKLVDGAVTRTITHQGVLLQLPAPESATVIARGYYLVTPILKTGVTLSGAIEIAVP